jgi:hypothetical protein
MALRTSGLTMDSPLYVRMADALGRSAEVLGPAHHGYPALVALAGLVITGQEWPGRIVSFVASLALVAVTYALARRSLPPWGAAVAAGLVAAHPVITLYGVSLMTEPTFLALAYGALLLLLPAKPSPPEEKTPQSGRTLAAGAAMGLAYCVRPEGLVLALAALPALAPWRRRAAWLGAFLVLASAEVILLSVERGAPTLTPKTDLMVASAAAKDDAEWRVRDADSIAAAAPVSGFERLRAAAPAAIARVPDRARAVVARLLEAWPLPLLALSLAGAILRPNLLLAPFAVLLVLPAMGTTPDVRFLQTLVPALAVFAAIGAWQIAERARARLGDRARVPIAAVLALVVAAGVAWCWIGPAGRRTGLEDVPMRSMRRAGQWLAAYAPPGSLVMDRKPYVPFFAGMRHTHMPNDDYDTIVEYARRIGVDFIVVEEHVMTTMRPQFVPVMTDPEFRKGETRVRLVFGGDEGPGTGVAIFQVVRPR